MPQVNPWTIFGKNAKENLCKPRSRNYWKKQKHFQEKFQKKLYEKSQTELLVPRKNF